MKMFRVLAVVSLGMMSASVFAQQTFTPPTLPNTRDAQTKQLPKGKWFENERGFLEAKEYQVKTGTNMLVYFYNHDEKDEKGLCFWWERNGMQEGKVDKLLEGYIKVKVRVPLKEKEQGTFSAYKFNKTPAVFVARPTGSPTKIQIFTRENDKMKLRENAELADSIEQASIPKAGAQTFPPGNEPP